MKKRSNNKDMEETGEIHNFLKQYWLFEFIFQDLKNSNSIQYDYVRSLKSIAADEIYSKLPKEKQYEFWGFEFCITIRLKLVDSTHIEKLPLPLPLKNYLYYDMIDMDDNEYEELQKIWKLRKTKNHYFVDYFIGYECKNELR